MSNTGFKVRFDENGDIVDILGGGCLKSTPEEKVRQRFIETLINEYHYPANTIRREVPDPTWVEGAPGQGREPGARGHRRLRVQGRLPEP